MHSELLTPAELVERFRNTVSARTLANWRSTRQGPPYVKVGGRVLYPKDGLLEWEAKRTRAEGHGAARRPAAG